MGAVAGYVADSFVDLLPSVVLYGLRQQDNGALHASRLPTASSAAHAMDHDGLPDRAA